MSNFFDFNQLLGIVPNPLSKQQNNDFQKLVNDAKKQAKQDMPITKCLLCGSPQHNCNSHTVPQRCLKNISINGYLNYSASFIDIQNDALKEDKGVNETGTFRLICRNCDSSFFQPYESFEKWTDVIPEKYLHEIAVKNYLKHYEKKYVESKFPDYLLKSFNNPIATSFYKLLGGGNSENDTLEAQIVYDKFEECKSLENNLSSNFYEILFYKKLNYTVPYAFQYCINMITDFRGTLINNLLTTDKNVKLEDIHICVFPLSSNESIILAFYNKNYNYKKLKEDLELLEEKDQLAVINYIIFKYSEDFYISPLLKDKMINNVNFSSVVTSSLLCQQNISDPIKAQLSEFDLNLYKFLPNLLLKEYSMEELQK